MESTLPGETTQEVEVLQRIQSVSMNMTGWLKFLGIINIISGALSALSIVGIVVAWLPIWLGVLLLQAGNRASNAAYSKDPRELVAMLDKLRLYFVIQGILFIIMIAFVVISIFAFGSFFSGVMSQFEQF